MMMKRYVLFALLCSVAFFVAGCGNGVNYKNIFPLSAEVWENAVPVPGMRAFIVGFSEEDFNSNKTLFEASGFERWNEMKFKAVYDGKKEISKDFFNSKEIPLYSVGVKNRKQGQIPVMIFFKESSQLIVVIADTLM